MKDLPRGAMRRSLKFASLPLGHMSRTAAGVGKRVAGRPGEMVKNEIQQRTAAQIFTVLGEMKGGAQKFGQILSTFEASMPEEIARPYRGALTRLQESAPPMDPASIHGVLAAELGKTWRDSFGTFDDEPVASASIGQVHRATWHDGTPVAVKVQYPGVADALRSDWGHMTRLGRLLSPLTGDLDVRGVLEEFGERLEEELDYVREAADQAAFAEGFAGDPDFYVPRVIEATDRVIVTEWMEGTPLSAIIESGDQEARDRAGLLLVRFLMISPSRIGLLHGDPHPGNFRITGDGRLGVIDFGAVDRLPDGLPKWIGRFMGTCLTDDSDALITEMREAGFLSTDAKVDAVKLHRYMAPSAKPLGVERFHFSREWLREQLRLTSSARAAGALKMNMPRQYVMLQRVWLGELGVLCQLGADVPFRGEALENLPGFAEVAG